MTPSSARRWRGSSPPGIKAPSAHFLSIPSDELRTPLTPVLAAINLIEQDITIPPQLIDHLRMMRRNVETEARLVDDLLDITRIARGKVELHREVVDAHSVLH